MKSNNKPKQSTNNKKRIIGDSSSRLVAGTLVGFIRATVSKIISSASFVAATPAIAIFVFAALSLSLFCGSNVFAEDSITVTIDNPNLNVNVAPKNANGTFAKSNDSTISVKTTNATGYTLGIKASGSNPTKLINGSDSDSDTNYLTSVSSATTEEQFKALAGTTYNGMWGYLPSRYCTASSNGGSNSSSSGGSSDSSGNTCSTNSDFLPAPTAAGDTLDETTTANSTPNTYTLAIGARVDASQKLGSYSNTYVVYASANAISYSIVYDDNVVSNMPEDVNSGQAVSGNVAFSSNTPTRDGYTFLGWCTVPVADSTSSDGASSCASAGGTYYAAGATTTISAATALHLYAVWEKVATLADITYMQDAFSCTDTPDGATNTLTDIRDGKTYAVAKINGTCWMTQNLRYKGDTGSASNSMTVKAATTNVASDTTIPYTDLTSGNTHDAARIHVATSDQVPSGANYTATDMGIWYNYAAASAMTITNYYDDDADAYNLCPKNWTLPTYNQQSSIAGSGTYRTIFSPVTGGYYVGGSLSSVGNGYWWSATANNIMFRYNLSYDVSSLGTGYNGRAAGLYVRCIRTS